MQYMLLIHDDEQVWGGMGEADRGRIFGDYMAYSKALTEAGAFVAGSALQGTSTATVVREQDGETLTTDGPFAETKEQLAGYYLIDVESLDEAIDWAAKIPSVRVGGAIEIRPLQEMPAEVSG
jgi:hypothetical protein